MHEFTIAKIARFYFDLISDTNKSWLCFGKTIDSLDKILSFTKCADAEFDNSHFGAGSINL